MYRLVLFLAIGSFVSQCACVSSPASGRIVPPGDPDAGSRQRFRAVAYEAAFDAAQEAVAEQFRVAQSDRERGIIRAEPVELGVETAGDRLLGDAVRASRRARRTATVLVLAQGADVEVTCRVLLQTDQSGAVSSIRRDARPTDNPHDTPADRDAAVTPEQQRAWVDQKRDRDTERVILAAIRERLEKLAPVPETASPALPR